MGGEVPAAPPAPLGAAQPLGRCCCPLGAGRPLLPPKSSPASAPKMLKWSQRAQSDPNQLGKWGWVPHSTPVHTSAFPSSSQPGALLPSSRSLLSQIRHQKSGFAPNPGRAWPERGWQQRGAEERRGDEDGDRNRDVSPPQTLCLGGPGPQRCPGGVRMLQLVELMKPNSNPRCRAMLPSCHHPVLFSYLHSSHAGQSPSSRALSTPRLLLTAARSINSSSRRTPSPLRQE